MRLQYQAPRRQRQREAEESRRQIPVATRQCDEGLQRCAQDASHGSADANTTARPTQPHDFRVEFAGELYTPTRRVRRDEDFPGLLFSETDALATRRHPRLPVGVRVRRSQCAFIRAPRSGEQFCVRTVSHAPRNPGATRSLTGRRRRTSMVREVVDRKCVGGIQCASARAKGINFQACSFNHSDISPL